MNITELDQYRLEDAVKFNSELNPRLWDENENLRPEVRSQLLKIAADFQEFLGVSDLDVKDITVSGSNAAYTYTPKSDIDLHLLIDLPQADESEVFRELFDAKKFQYNTRHNITIGGYDVELYVQNPNQPVRSAGEYSVLNDKWIQVPRRVRADVDHASVRSKYEHLEAQIHKAIQSNDSDIISALARKIRNMRQASLDQHGEFSVENLAFKLLRAHGLIKQLYDARDAARSAELSLTERKKKKSKRRVKYGFGGWFYPGYNYDSGAGADTGDGGGSGESIQEQAGDDIAPVVHEFIQQVADQLGLNQVPEIELHHDDWAEQERSFGRYDPDTHTLHVSMKNRHVMDIMRTVAHELAHARQNQDQDLPANAGKTGSPWENQANAVAGIVMRNMAQQNPDLFDHTPITEASGYIPTEREKNDPRFSMALTRDVRPGATGREANKLALKTNAQGEPTLLIRNLRNALREFKESNNELDLFEVRMNPRALQRAAAGSGATAGLEFEMIVPVELPEDDDYDIDYDPEPDWDEDRAADDIDDVISFFDENDANTFRQLRDLRSELQDEFDEWQQDEVSGDWQSDQREFIRDYLDNNPDEYDEEEARRQAVSEITDANPDLDTDSKDYAQLVNQRMTELFDEFVQQVSRISRSWAGSLHDRIYDEFRSQTADDYSESEWLSRNYPRMSDIQSNFDVSWPYMTEPESQSSRLEGIKQVALDFMRAMGHKKVAAGEDYHGPYYKYTGGSWISLGSSKPTDCYTIEPDGSLEAEDSGETGLEFVSPPMPIEQMAQDIRKVKEWAGMYGCYTNTSTGLHMNVSVPDRSSRDLDFVKLALLLGDQHVLKQYQREANTYAKSAVEKVAQIVASSPELASQAMAKLQQGLNTLASRTLQNTSVGKYTSIHPKYGYVEFRSPGGDYLSRDANELINTMNRMVVALQAATDPEAYKKEYSTKLYKLLNPQGLTDPYGDMIREFSDYVTDVGGASAETVKQFRTNAARYLQAQNIARRPDPTKRYVWEVDMDPKNANSPAIRLVASTPKEALDKAASEWSMSLSRLRPTARVTLVAPYVDVKPSKQGKWGIWNPQIERFIVLPDESGRRSAGLRRYNSQEEAEKWLANYRATNIGIRRDLDVREIPDNYQPGMPAGVQTNADQPAAVQVAGPRTWYVSLIGQPETEIMINHATSADDAIAYARVARPGVFAGQSDIRASIEPEGPTQPTAQAPAAEQLWHVMIGPQRMFNVRGATQADANAAAATRLSDYQRQVARERGVEITVVPANSNAGAGASGEFTGEWRIVDPSGQEIHRFGGVGNVQADANRVAMSWLQRNPEHLQSGVEVVPVMSE